RSSNKKIYITTNDEDDISYNITLSKFEEEHMKSFFLRIHQGWIINFHKKFDLDLFEQKVIFKGKESVLVPFTKNYLGALKQKMNISKTRKPFTK
ncbi:MAG: LytTR family transcriptional regulator DNA-binding domain-containing protein, partial [Bacteroidota bacterium]